MNNVVFALVSHDLQSKHRVETVKAVRIQHRYCNQIISLVLMLKLLNSCLE